MPSLSFVHTVRTYRWTVVGTVVAATLYLLSSLTGLEVYETISAFFARFERYQLDEAILGISLIAWGILSDLLRARRRRRQQAEIRRCRHVISTAVVLSAKEVVNTFQSDFRSLIARAGSGRVSEDEFIEDLGGIFSTMSSRLNTLTDGYISRSSSKECVDPHAA